MNSVPLLFLLFWTATIIFVYAGDKMTNKITSSANTTIQNLSPEKKTEPVTAGSPEELKAETQSPKDGSPKPIK